MLPATADAINKGQVNVLVLGDSIPCGSETTRSDRAFVPLWASRFEETHNVSVTICNRALPGMTIKDGLRDARRWYKRRFPADLVIIAFGVNCQTPSKYRQKPKLSPHAFWEHASELGDFCAPADVVYVSPLIPSRKWTGNTDLVPVYADSLRRLVADKQIMTKFGVALADVTAVWPGNHLLANGWNHPGDEGHALYADVLTAAVEAGLPPTARHVAAVA